MSKRMYESYKPLYRNPSWHKSDHPSTTSNDFLPREDARSARDERDEPDWRHQNTFDPRHRRSSYHVPSVCAHYVLIKSLHNKSYNVL